tara:strand:+ start:2589 stop:3056 length:468 start_codon:yes stop_codon:yes gene_type:complete
MSKSDQSLLGGRNTRPLTDREITQVIRYFYAFDRAANVRYEADSATLFRPKNDEDEYDHEIVFGPDIFPGNAVNDPNSLLGVRGAVAHELAHKFRHSDLTEINEPELTHLDEALTSLSAILRFHDDLDPHEIRQLISDAVHRLQSYVREVRAGDD